MSDCIDRQTIINLLTSRAETLRGLYGDLGSAASGVRKLVQTLPSTEPERKKGKWVVKEKDWRKQQSWNECSECGFTTSRQYNFCPNCGSYNGDDNELQID